ncbi:exopolysaccharide biosynthesis polyprenyl glycosylphosphotransferase [Lichenibacterium dinghuense]|uniref:exopolysaccharide biosynthesis polyprenyl glycosylphosphotransferase n=1 Tax=Lichenibacterium dinghuense TaxID=2895977 RepID=UPI001EFFB1AC|nr:exopolysaccharide biosynthesis polyprenyl glycosylphosphotransferase [Lichenibacterium sp. 6Y81]
MPRAALLSASLAASRRRSLAHRLSRVRPSTALTRVGFLLLAAGLDAAAILGIAAASGAALGHGAEPFKDIVLGAAMAVLFVVPGALRHDYAITRYLSHKGHAKRALTLWGMAAAGALGFAFLTKTTDSFSRGGTLGLVVGGAAGLLVLRTALVGVMQSRAAAGRVASRHIFLVGDEDMIRAFSERHAPHQVGLRVVGAAVLRPGEDTRADDLALAVASARVIRPDDVYILVPWGDRDRLDAAIDAFMGVPAAVHLAPERFLDKFDDLHVIRNGSVASLHLVRRPLSSSEVLAKRALDVALAAAALLVLAPLFAAMAVLIRRESPGPVFFKQRRYGFNQEPFRIYKFRSMSVAEDGRAVRQATAGDSRITRIGRFMRRTNVDELPQLLNVLRGEMSLVGPRPHAMAHDQAFEREVALYARRHNVRPGITGWAQVNGWRGETDTPEKVIGRVEHDLYYIDNWSLMLDLSIMVRTVFSRKAYRNAG